MTLGRMHFNPIFWKSLWKVDFYTVRDRSDVTTVSLALDKRRLNDDGEGADIETIKKGVEDFRNWLLHDGRYSQNNDYQKMIEQLDKYWEKLFAEVLFLTF